MLSSREQGNSIQKCRDQSSFRSGTARDGAGAGAAAAAAAGAGAEAAQGGRKEE